MIEYLRRYTSCRQRECSSDLGSTCDIGCVASPALGQYAVIREAVLTNIHRQTREKTEFFTRFFLEFGVNI